MVLDKAVYNKLFKEWQAWRGSGRKLPNRFLHPTRRRAFEAWNQATWAGGKKNYKEDEIIKTPGHPGVPQFSRVVAQGGAAKPQRVKFRPITITSTQILINRRELKDQINYYRWLLRHPALLKGLISRYLYDRRTIEDSALFL